MRRRRLIRLAALAFLACVVCVPVLYLGLAWRVRQGMQPSLIEFEGPVPLKEARRLSSLPLPDSATRIRYARYSEFIAFIEVVRFEAPLDDCRSFAETVIATYNAAHPDRCLPMIRLLPMGNRMALAGQPAAPNELLKPLNAPWFVPATIRTCMIAGERGSHQPMIWIDVDRGEVYYLLTD